MSDAIDSFLVAKIAEGRPDGGRALRVLDLPAGDGELSRKLDAAGLSVTGADLFPNASGFRPERVVRADMNRRLPFEDGAFDVLVCQEGIEHLENVAAFLRECRRVLREGGELWLTTPNVMDLSSRLAFFWLGIKSFHGDLPNEEATLWGASGESYYHGHAFTLPFFQIRYLLRIEDFDEIELHGLKPSGTSRALYWALRPLAGVCVRRALRRRNARDRADGRPAASGELLREIERLALSPELLCNGKIGIRAVRREGSFRPAEQGG
ncbi:MAG: class I SAM-dependent methyltransferase [Proteobacteria bacterium]|nr:class I SAM-dependent methyltransferase [Pseudomonadota bacterium]